MHLYKHIDCILNPDLASWAVRGGDMATVHRGLTSTTVAFTPSLYQEGNSFATTCMAEWCWYQTLGTQCWVFYHLNLRQTKTGISMWPSGLALVWDVWGLWFEPRQGTEDYKAGRVRKAFGDGNGNKQHPTTEEWAVLADGKVRL